MASRVAWSLGLLLVALALGVPSAGGRSLATGTLVVQVLGDGNVTATGGQIACGQGSTRCYFTTTSSATITLTASVGFANWAGSDDCFTPTQSCTFTLNTGDKDEEVANFAPTAPTTLTVNVTGDSEGGGNVTSGDSSEIDCDAGDTDCTWDVYTGSTVTLIETPGTGYDFTGWGGPCSGTDVSCTVAMSSAQTVNATFAKSSATKTLTVSVTGNGTVTGGGIACTAAGGTGCSASVSTGSSVTLTATAGSGAGFTGWGGACVGSTTTCTVTMSSDQSVTAGFSGSGSGGGAAPSTFPLTVSVSGQGSVRGGGLSCGAGGDVCSSNEPAGSSVTLTAEPADDADFTGWGGACSGTATTCTLTMSSARTVSATFSGGSTVQVPLTVSVTGRGTVTGGSIRCGNGASACSSKETQGSTVGLTATPAAGATFNGWGGACGGTVQTCTVTMSSAKTVSARFSGRGASRGSGSAALRSRGAPVVTRTGTGFAVTLRFRAARRGPVRVRALRAGRLQAALSFNAPSGPASAGPFPLAKPGFYLFDLTQAGVGALHWRACLGRCGEAAARRAGPFTLTRQPPSVIDAGALWSVTLRFGSTQPAGAELRIYRGRKLARDVRFPSGVGSQRAGPFLLSPGSYTLRLGALDAYGRARSLTWVALLP